MQNFRASKNTTTHSNPNGSQTKSETQPGTKTHPNGKTKTPVICYMLIPIPERETL